MAAALRHSNKLLQTAFFDSCKQPFQPLKTPFFKISRPFCAKYATDVELKTSDPAENIDNETKNTKPRNFATKSQDTFGTLRIPLEKLKKDKQNYGQSFLPKNYKDAKTEKKSRSRLSNKEDDSDKFGDLTSDSTYYAEIVEPEPEGDTSTEFISGTAFKPAIAYLRDMKFLVKQQKLKEALELFPEMKKNNVRPIHANYTFMIGACGRAGYTDMAFRLLRIMTNKGLRPTPATLTGLFNSCAEGPFTEESLKKATFLKEKIFLKNWQITQPTYHAMIKAFGKCGDMLTAFQIVDEMIQAGIKCTAITYNFLLMSCISDKEAGFTHVIEVWRKLIAKKHFPDIFTFNLLLRAVRDCGVGTEETASLLLQHWTSYSKRPYGFNRKENAFLDDMVMLPNPQLSLADGKNATKLIESGDPTSVVPLKRDGQKEELFATDDLKNMSTEMSVIEDNQEILTNLLSRRPVNGPNIVELLAIHTSTQKLALLGSAEGFLETMSAYKVNPDIKTFTLLLDSSSPTNESETALLALMDKYGVKPDTDFFNMLIKRRNVRRDADSAKQVLLLLNKYNLCPDIVTFGVLSLGCYNRKHGVQLLRDIKRLQCHANVEIMGGLIHNASRNFDFGYLKAMLDEMKYQEIQPDERFLKKLENRMDVARRNIIDKERGKEVRECFTVEHFDEQYYAFLEYYSEWLKYMKVEKELHPWDQFKTEAIAKYINPNNVSGNWDKSSSTVNPIYER